MPGGNAERRCCMIKLRSRAAICCARIVYEAVTRLGRGSGSSLPGRIARWIDPEILSVLPGMVRKKVIAVTGTNGKTTVNGILTHVLEAQGQKVISNRLGANLSDGILSAFVLAAGRGGRPDADYACIEVDELATGTVFPWLQPDLVIVTNIFRDQLDRVGEIDVVCGRIRRALQQTPGAKLVINGDDAASCMLLSDCEIPSVTFGISESLTKDFSAEPREMIFCPVCGARLRYDFYQYGQLGVWHCPGCGLRRPEPDMTATDIGLNGDRYSYILDGMYMETQTAAPSSVYNTLAAYTALWALDAPRDRFRTVMEHFDYGNNRESVYTINGAHVQLHLAKNPVGLQQKLYLIRRDPRPKDVVIQINDTKLDGEDVSWLWDVDYRYLAEAAVETVVTGGMRGHDVELCLKYENIVSRTAGDVRGVIEELTRRGSKNLYVITNYSGLYRTNHMLRELQSCGKEGVGS